MKIITVPAPPAAVFVDEAVHPWRGRLWAHLFSPDLEALHAFADRLGLRRDWFQRPPRASWPHYDVTAAKRAQAIRLGALAADRPTTLEVAWLLQGALTPAREARLAAYRASPPSVSAASVPAAAPVPEQIGFPGF
ncbi:hypothetical protein BHAOGJBA_2912 [Methylobacterium hispanicum]|uniref:DUF4031 domain-containing protein n=1 Tax=Methylobacterium hispanicum TaxID=270350 RepID=A0AAV4ZP90_9HYPH|nr:DUF4031 domain-containing protein [Methylobacterium hispanicum]GJD89385.1 hypothetical protein BHAOGJBA_2912 [Methylobacterium hispanicum]